MITIYFIYDKNAPESNDGNNADDTNAPMDKSIAPPSKTSLDTTNRKNTTENTNNNDHPTMIMLIDNCFSWQDKPLAFSWDTTNPQTKQTPSNDDDVDDNDYYSPCKQQHIPLAVPAIPTNYIPNPVNKNMPVVPNWNRFIHQCWLLSFTVSTRLEYDDNTDLLSSMTIRNQPIVVHYKIPSQPAAHSWFQSQIVSHSTVL